MVADLLFGIAPDLPGGKSRKHLCLTYRKAQKDAQEQNIEAVFQAISSGHTSVKTIMYSSGLSKTTVFNACQTLLNTNRITVGKGCRPHSYLAKEK